MKFKSLLKKISNPVPENVNRNVNNSVDDNVNDNADEAGDCSFKTALDDYAVKVKSKNILKYPCPVNCGTPSRPVMKYGENLAFFKMDPFGADKNSNRNEAGDGCAKEGNEDSKNAGANKNKGAGDEGGADGGAANVNAEVGGKKSSLPTMPYLGRDDHNPPMQSIADYVRVAEELPNTPIVEIDFVDAEFQDSEHMTRVYHKLISNIHDELDAAHTPPKKEQNKCCAFKKAPPRLGRWLERDVADSFKTFSSSTEIENSPLEEALFEVGEAYDCVASLKDELRSNVSLYFLESMKTFIDLDFKCIEQSSKQVYEAAHKIRKAKLTGVGKSVLEEMKKTFSESRAKTLQQFHFVLRSDYSQISKLIDLAECWLLYFREGYAVFDFLCHSLESKALRIKPRRHKRLCIIPPRPPIQILAHQRIKHSEEANEHHGSGEGGKQKPKSKNAATSTTSIVKRRRGHKTRDRNINFGISKRSKKAAVGLAHHHEMAGEVPTEQVGSVSAGGAASDRRLVGVRTTGLADSEKVGGILSTADADRVPGSAADRFFSRVAPEEAPGSELETVGGGAGFVDASVNAGDPPKAVPSGGLFANMAAPARHQCACPRDQLMFLPAMAPASSFGGPSPFMARPASRPGSESAESEEEEEVTGPTCECHCDCPELEPGFPRWWKDAEKKREAEKHAAKLARKTQPAPPPEPEPEPVPLTCYGPNHILKGPCVCEEETIRRLKDADENRDFLVYRQAREQHTPYAFVRAAPNASFPGNVGDAVELVFKNKIKGEYNCRLLDGTKRQTTIPFEYLDVIVDVDNRRK